LVQKVLTAEHRIPTIRQAAAGLRLSERTLIRRLAMAGTSFRALADDERRLRALSLIIDPGLDIQEVSDRLGFPDRSVFGRKFRSWTGETPSVYRASRTRAGRALERGHAVGVRAPLNEACSSSS
jgi:AraC-like DNA-binding protein